MEGVGRGSPSHSTTGRRLALGALEKRFAGAFGTAGVAAVAIVVSATAIVLISVMELVDRRLNTWAT